MTADEFQRELQETNGSKFRGYKGGDYEMSESTPVWVANRGSSNGFKHRNQGVVGVEERAEHVVIQTSDVPF